MNFSNRRTKTNFTARDSDGATIGVQVEKERERERERERFYIQTVYNFIYNYILIK
jgi:hypothetical protein